MCGIFGCVGKNAYIKVLEGLKLLQYRGYDSCGIAYFENGFKTEKSVGPLENLKLIDTKSQIAFGHTRWATNGEVNYLNAHPHVSYNKEIYVVHNGIIKNADTIKEKLTKENILFYSNTDTEVIANLISYQSNLNGLENALKNLFSVLEGSFSLIVGTKNGNLYLIKKFSPLNVLISDNEIYISSDETSLKNGKLYKLKDNDIIKISNKKITKLNDKNLTFTNHENSLKSLSLNKHQHFMHKEIFETPTAIEETYNEIKDLDVYSTLNQFSKITLIGCGTAYHSCLIGAYWLKRDLKKSVETYLASNYEISEQISKNHLHIIVSQSGETADCIRVAEEIKKHNGKILVITNQNKSTIANMADLHIFTHAKKEIAVASTKTYCCQLFVFAYICKKLQNPDYDLNIKSLSENLKNYLKILNIKAIAEQLKDVNRMILIAKDIDYITILEASLKIREIDYIFTLPMYSGELKHGTLSLVDENCYVITLNSDTNSNKLQNAVNEIKSRKGNIIDFSQIVKANVDEYFKPIFAIIPFQLLSYQISVINGRNPDMPRNLAKSVTVE